jgi:hypothetical protein
MNVQCIAILSDIHYASAAEQERRDYESRGISNPLMRLALRLYRRYIWLRNPCAQNHLLDQFLSRAGEPDLVIANGDYSCNTAFVGVSDEASRESAAECLSKLRSRFGSRFLATYGDHELGKFSMVGQQGGMRLASWHAARNHLGLKPFWTCEAGNYLLMGVVSSLIALPAYEPETMPEERACWRQLRQEHLEQITTAFHGLAAGQKVLLFCHDPTALPFLAREDAVRSRLSQIEQTVIGHLHSPLILWKSQVLAGMPHVSFLGNTVRRLSGALRDARHWKPFRVRLCPSLAGIELLKDGGFLTLELDPSGKEQGRFLRHRIHR